MSESDDPKPGFGNQRVRQIYRDGMYNDETPEYPVKYQALRERAWEQMDESARAYVRGGSGTEATFRNNQQFSQHQIMPRMLRGVEDRELTVDLLGNTHPFPVMVTPLAAQSLLHEEAELATARACADLGVPFTLSSLSSTPMEEVANALGDTTKWFQLYWSSDQAVVESFLDRAEASGYDAIVLTVDAPTLGWRDRLIAQGYYPFVDGHGTGNYFSDPAFREPLPVPPEEDPAPAVERFLETFGDESLTWADLSVLRANTDLPIIIKGVLHPDDARLALEHGADAVQVSTHGGRQVDGAVGAIEALPDVAAAVGTDAPVLFDSGVRRGSHAFKALALGADTIMLGRPFAYGLAMAGQDGVRWVLENLLAELDLTMGLAGYDDVTEIDTAALRGTPTG